MERRDFLRCTAAIPIAAAAAALPTQKPVIRLPTDCDLSVRSFEWAATEAGWVDPPNTYYLRVHPANADRAEQVLRELFKDEWRAHLILDDLLTNVDTWYLEGSKAIVHSAGA